MPRWTSATTREAPRRTRHEDAESRGPKERRESANITRDRLLAMLAMPGTYHGVWAASAPCGLAVSTHSVRCPSLLDQQRHTTSHETYEEEQADGQAEDGDVVDVHEHIRTEIAFLRRGLEDLHQPHGTTSADQRPRRRTNVQCDCDHDANANEPVRRQTSKPNS